MPEAEPVIPSRIDSESGATACLHPLGIGGMSSVYLAVHLESGSEVALKVLPPFLARNPTSSSGFSARPSAESLEHPNIVSIYDRGSDHGRHYLVLEYVDGATSTTTSSATAAAAGRGDEVIRPGRRGPRLRRRAAA